jgi:hypothetical protein
MLYLSSGAQRGSGFQLGGTCKSFVFDLPTFIVVLNYNVSVIWRSMGFWLSAGRYMWGICICSLYLSSGAQRGSGFQVAGICWAFVFVLCTWHLALDRVLAFSWPLYVGHLCLFFYFGRSP